MNNDSIEPISDYGDDNNPSVNVFLKFSAILFIYYIDVLQEMKYSPDNNEIKNSNLDEDDNVLIYKIKTIFTEQRKLTF